jgi:hypothetical protein
MTNLFTLFANNILPIFLAAGAGFLLSRAFNLNPRPISQVAFYIFIPCLVFNLLTTSHLTSNEILRIILFTIVSVLLLGLLTWGLGKLLKFERRLLVAVLLAAMFGNAGNFGLSLNLFAFGESALAYATLYFVTITVLTYTVGVVLASLGSTGLKEALVGLIKVPALYAVAAALLFNAFQWKLPLPADRTVALLGDATIPVLIILLGIQLETSRWDRRLLALGLTNTVRLLVAPFLAIGLALLFGIRATAMQAVVSQSATPTMVMTALLATEYDVEPAFVTAAVVTTTLLSPLTMTPLLAFLGA